MKIFGIACAILLSVSASMALADRVRCNFDKATTAHFIPDQIDIEFDPVGGSAIVFDSQFDAITDAPMQGDIVTANKVRQTIAWKSPLITPDFYRVAYNRSFNIEFRLTLPRGKHTVVLYYKALQLGVFSTNEVSARAGGTCNAM